MTFGNCTSYNTVKAKRRNFMKIKEVLEKCIRKSTPFMSAAAQTNVTVETKLKVQTGQKVGP